MEEDNLYNELFNAPPPGPENQKKFQRSGSNVVIAGVCSGLSDYFGIDTDSIRVIAILSLLFGYWGPVLYLVLAFLIPAEKYPPQIEQDELILQKRENIKTVSSGIFILLGIHYSLVNLGFSRYSSLIILPSSFSFSLIAIAMGVFLLRNNHQQLLFEPRPISFVRQKNGKWIYGVCTGMAKYLNLDVALIRIAFVLLTLVTLGVFSLIYLLFTLITPTVSPIVQDKDE